MRRPIGSTSSSTPAVEERRPRKQPKIDSALSLCVCSWKGKTRAKGFPRFVTRTGSPVEFTSAITAKHLALNSPAAIVRMAIHLTLSIYQTMVI